MTEYLKKKSLSEFTKKEFLAFVSRICNAEEKTEEEGNIDVRHFDMLFPRPISK